MTHTVVVLGAKGRMGAFACTLLRGAPDFARIDQDFRHLLGSWFNRGFLVMQPIDWNTPAAVLEKITVEPVVATIPVGTTQEYKATGIYTDGTIFAVMMSDGTNRAARSRRLSCVQSTSSDRRLPVYSDRLETFGTTKQAAEGRTR